jgi:hypothetical protein
MPKLKKQESRHLYIFHSYKNNRKLRKYSGDEVTEEEIREWEIPEALLKREKKENANKKSGRIGETSPSPVN